jgi:hypothetical protein
MRTLLISLSLVALFAPSCMTVDQGSGNTQANLGPWVAASPSLQRKIESQAERLPWTHGIDRVELIQWFAGVGEPAYGTLLGLVLDPRTDVAGAALAALGSTRDSRLVEPLRLLPWPPASNLDLALERARTLLRLGDWSMVPVLMEGLADKRLMTRALCSQALFEATHERFGFDPNGSPVERASAVDRWQGWWFARSGDLLLDS